MAKQALEGKRGNVFHMDPNDLVIIGLDTKDGPEHPLYDERIMLPIDENMVLNIMHNGILQPILVRKDGEAPQVVVGRHRVRCCREANVRLAAQGKQTISVPVMVRRGIDKDMLGMMISENEIRRGDNPLTKARKAQKLLDMGASEEEVALNFGVSTKAISNWVRILDCDTTVVKAVEDGSLSASAASKLASMPRAEQREELKAMIASGEATTKQATAVAQAKAKANASQKKNGGEPASADLDVIVPPGKKVITKVLAAVEAGAELDTTPAKVLKWVTGQIKPSSLKGLSKILNGIEQEVEDKKVKAAEAREAKAAKAREAKGRKSAPPKPGDKA